MAKVGKMIKTIRVKQNLTQDELANKIHVSRQTISNYETGKSNPDIDMLVELAVALDTDANTLIYGEPMQVDEKIRWRRLRIMFICTALYGVIAFGLNGAMRSWINKTYSVMPFIMVRVVMLSIFWGVLGWCAMEFVLMAFHVQPLKGKVARWVHIITIGLVGVYFALVTPWLVKETYDFFKFYGDREGYLMQGNVFGMKWYTYILFIQYLAHWVSEFFSILFFVPGVLLRATERKQITKN